MAGQTEKQRIYTVATAHLDTSWLWDLETTIREYIPDTLKTNFALFEKYPEYVFNFEGSYRYELMKEYYPELYEKLREYVAQGRWVPAGSCYENGDVNTPSPEALFRNILYGNGFFEREFGIRTKDIFIPDCFGFGFALPSIARHANLIGFSTGKLQWGSAYGIPFDLGKWYGVDGNFVFAELHPGSYTRTFKKVRGLSAAESKLRENKKIGLPFTVLYHGTGDRGGAPSELSVATVVSEQLRNAEEDIEVWSAGSARAFEEMAAMDRDRLKRVPEWRNELLLTNHGVGSYTSRAVSKRWNRRSEQLADAAERSASASLWAGAGEYPQETLDTAWKRTIAHQFHDDITGTSFQVCYKRNWNDYVLSMNLFAGEYEAACGRVASLMDTSFAQGVPVLVSNPCQCSAERVEAVEASVTMQKHTPFVKVFDPLGAEVPSQIKARRGKVFDIVFLAAVPSVGMKVYDVRPSESPCTEKTDLYVNSSVLENAKYKVLFDANGDIADIYDKTIDKSILSAPVSLDVHNYVGSKAWPAWELDYKDVSSEPRGRACKPKFKIAEFGPARIAIETLRTFEKSTFKQTVSLDSRGDTIRVYNEIDWHCGNSLLKVRFPLAASNGTASYDLGLGVIERGSNTPKLYEVPAQMWADITDDGGEFGVSVFSDSRSGWDKPDDNTLRLTGMHSPFSNYRWECSQHLLEFGLNRFSFGIFSHKGLWHNKTQSRALYFNQPMAVFAVSGACRGPLGPSFSFASVSNSAVLIRAIKKAQDSDEIIVRFNEGSNRFAKNVSFTIGSGIESAREVYASEEPKGEANVVDGSLVFDILPFEPKTFALKLAPPPFKAPAPEQTPLALPYDLAAVTGNQNRSRGELAGGLSVPDELFPAEILSGGVRFATAKGAADGKTALVCAGQTIPLPKGTRKVHLLAAARGGDTAAVFKTGSEETALKIADCFEAVGAWDLAGLDETGYLKRDALAWHATHAHDRTGDVLGKQIYFFRYTLDAGGGPLVLPVNDNIVLLAATADAGASSCKAAADLYDRLEKRAPDFNLTADQRANARPNQLEKKIAENPETGKVFKIAGPGFTSKFQIRDVISTIRTQSMLLRRAAKINQIRSGKKR